MRRRRSARRRRGTRACPRSGPRPQVPPEVASGRGRARPRRPTRRRRRTRARSRRRAASPRAARSSTSFRRRRGEAGVGALEERRVRGERGELGQVAARGVVDGERLVRRRRARRGRGARSAAPAASPSGCSRGDPPVARTVGDVTGPRTSGCVPAASTRTRPSSAATRRAARGGELTREVAGRHADTGDDELDLRGAELGLDAAVRAARRAPSRSPRPAASVRGSTRISSSSSPMRQQVSAGVARGGGSPQDPRLRHCRRRSLRGCVPCRAVCGRFAATSLLQSCDDRVNGAVNPAATLRATLSLRAMLFILLLVLALLFLPLAVEPDRHRPRGRARAVALVLRRPLQPQPARAGRRADAGRRTVGRWRSRPLAPTRAGEGRRRDLGGARRRATCGRASTVRVTAVDGLTLEVEKDVSATRRRSERFEDVRPGGDRLPAARHRRADRQRRDRGRGRAAAGRGPARPLPRHPADQRARRPTAASCPT